MTIADISVSQDCRTAHGSAPCSAPAQHDVVERTPLEELFAAQSKEEWVVERVLCAGSLNVLAADPGSGKSWLLEALAFSIASGNAFAGKYATPRPRRVLLIDQDTASDRFIDRLRSFSRRYGDPSRLIPRPHPGITLDTAEGRRALTALVESSRPDVVIFETLASLVSGSFNENKANHMAKILEPLKALTKRGIAVIVSHHLKKGASGGMHGIRGSSALTGAVDNVFLLTRKNPGAPVLRTMYLTTAKNRHDVIEGAAFQLTTPTSASTDYADVAWEHDISHDYDPDEAATAQRALDLLLEAASDGLTLREISARFDGAVDDKTLRSILRRMEGRDVQLARERHNTFRYYALAFAPQTKEQRGATTSLTRVRRGRYRIMSKN